jgi:hypothetical protein
MTRLYEMTLTISIRVEADDVREARKECTKIANEIIVNIGDLPTGACMTKPNHEPVNLI